jgi:hypothetical protein
MKCFSPVPIRVVSGKYNCQNDCSCDTDYDYNSENPSKLFIHADDRFFCSRHIYALGVGFVVLCLTASRVTFQTPVVHGLFIKEHLMFAKVRGCRQEIQFIVNVCASLH